MVNVIRENPLKGKVSRAVRHICSQAVDHRRKEYRKIPVRVIWVSARVSPSGVRERESLFMKEMPSSI
jgi:hypothetical protein